MDAVRSFLIDQFRETTLYNNCRAHEIGRCSVCVTDLPSHAPLTDLFEKSYSRVHTARFQKEYNYKLLLVNPRCMNAIHKKERKDAKQALADRQSGRQSDKQSQDTASMPYSSAIASYSSIATLRNVIFARTGRQYGVNNARRSFK